MNDKLVRSGSGGLRAPRLGYGRVQFCTECAECGCGSLPAQLIDVVKERDIGPKRGERSKKYRPIPIACESVGKGARICSFYVPLAVVRRNRFKMLKLSEDSC